jgi:transcriptional regulator with XRE-family HTH domain
MQELKIIGSNIAKLRKEKGWSVLKLAKESGVNRATISTLEDTNIPNAQFLTVWKIARALGTNLTFLIGGNNGN